MQSCGTSSPTSDSTIILPRCNVQDLTPSCVTTINAVSLFQNVPCVESTSQKLLRKGWRSEETGIYNGHTIPRWFAGSCCDQWRSGKQRPACSLPIKLSKCSLMSYGIISAITFATVGCSPVPLQSSFSKWVPIFKIWMINPFLHSLGTIFHFQEFSYKLKVRLWTNCKSYDKQFCLKTIKTFLCLTVLLAYIISLLFWESNIIKTYLFIPENWNFTGHYMVKNLGKVNYWWFCPRQRQSIRCYLSFPRSTGGTVWVEKFVG